jgi:hypothetical protein
LRHQFTPSQTLYERVALELGLDLPEPEVGLGRSCLNALKLWLLAPLRVVWHGLRGIIAKLLDKADEASGHVRIFQYWLDYFIGGPARCFRYYRRRRDIRSESFRPFQRTSG